MVSCGARSWYLRDLADWFVLLSDPSTLDPELAALPWVQVMIESLATAPSAPVEVKQHASRKPAGFVGYTNTVNNIPASSFVLPSPVARRGQLKPSALVLDEPRPARRRASSLRHEPYPCTPTTPAPITLSNRGAVASPTSPRLRHRANSSTSSSTSSSTATLSHKSSASSLTSLCADEEEAALALMSLHSPLQSPLPCFPPSPSSAGWYFDPTLGSMPSTPPRPDGASLYSYSSSGSLSDLPSFYSASSPTPSSRRKAWKTPSAALRQRSPRTRSSVGFTPLG